MKIFNFLFTNFFLIINLILNNIYSILPGDYIGMKDHINIKCPGCRKSFKAGFHEIEFMDVHKCPKCGYQFSKSEKTELYNAVYTYVKNKYSGFLGSNQNSNYA